MTRGAAPAADRLASLLTEQGDALRAGRLEELGAMAERLEAALGDLGPGLDAATLARIRARAGENARLIAAAREGLAHVETLRRAPASLSTYDPSGRLASFPTMAGRTLARR